MRRFVDGVELDLPEGEATVVRLGDRLIVHAPDGTYSAVAVRDGDAVLVSYRGRQFRVERRAARTASSSTASGELRAPMPGQVVDVRAAAGDAVKQGAVILVLEAMKTQQPLAAPFDGVVKEVGVVKGEQVDEGRLMARVAPA